MKARPVLAATALFVLAGCGDDGGSGAPDTTATTTAPTSTAEQMSTTVAPSSTAAVPEQVVAAQRLAGTYTGQWDNTTFASHGTMDATVTVDEASGTATLTLDIGGTAFGSPDPPAIETVLDLTGNGPIAGTNDFFGDFTVTIDDAGHLVFEAEAVPGVGGRTMTVDGTFADGGFTGTYVIAGLADGTFTCTRR